MEPKEMLREYQKSRDALKYGRIDPLSYKLAKAENTLNKIGRTLLRLQTAVIRGDRAVCAKVIGGTFLFAVANFVLPIWSILVFLLRTLYLIILVRITFIVPINRK